MLLFLQIEALVWFHSNVAPLKCLLLFFNCISRVSGMFDIFISLNYWLFVVE